MEHLFPASSEGWIVLRMFAERVFAMVCRTLHNRQQCILKVTK